MKKNSSIIIKIITFLATLVFVSACELDNEFTQFSWTALSQKQVDIAAITGPSQQDYTNIQIKAFRLGGEIRVAVLDKRNDGASMFYLLNENLETVYSKAVQDIKYQNGTIITQWDTGSPNWHIDGSPNDTIYGNNFFVISSAKPTDNAAFIIDPINDKIKGVAIGPYERLWSTGKGFFATANSAMGGQCDNKRLNVDLALVGQPEIDMNPILDGIAPLIETTSYSGARSQLIFGIGEVIDPITSFFTNRLVLKIADNLTPTTTLATTAEFGSQINSALHLNPSPNHIEDIRVNSSGIIVRTSPNEDTLLGFDGTIKYRFNLGRVNSSDPKSNILSAYVNDYDNWFIYDSEQKRIMRLRGWWL